MGASTLVLLILSPVNIFLNIALIHYTRLGFLGSPAALSITYWMALFILAFVAYISPVHRRNGTWGGLQLKAVLDPKSCYMFLELALPGILMVGTEWSVLSTGLNLPFAHVDMQGLPLRLWLWQLAGW